MSHEDIDKLAADRDKARARADRAAFPGRAFWAWWADSLDDSYKRAAHVAQTRRRPSWLPAVPVHEVEPRD